MFKDQDLPYTAETAKKQTNLNSHSERKLKEPNQKKSQQLKPQKKTHIKELLNKLKPLAQTSQFKLDTDSKELKE